MLIVCARVHSACRQMYAPGRSYMVVQQCEEWLQVIIIGLLMSSGLVHGGCTPIVDSMLDCRGSSLSFHIDSSRCFSPLLLRGRRIRTILIYIKLFTSETDSEIHFCFGFSQVLGFGCNAAAAIGQEQCIDLPAVSCEKPLPRGNQMRVDPD